MTLSQKTVAGAFNNEKNFTLPCKVRAIAILQQLTLFYLLSCNEKHVAVIWIGFR